MAVRLLTFVISLALALHTAAGMGASPRLPLLQVEGQAASLTPGFLGVGSVYMRISNSGKGDDTLLSVKANIRNSIVELHDIADGRMVKVDKIRIPAGRTVELRPRGPHIMVFNLPKETREGDGLILYLVFEKSGEKRIDLKFSRP